ncbi:MAG: hypothetical protein PVH61_08230 [Candidatus Aminicenantes bacterium]|jgi:hypothetical protein
MAEGHPPWPPEAKWFLGLFFYGVLLYNRAMNARKKIQEEKLFNILNPKRANKEFKITLRFRKQLTRKYEKAVELAKANKYFLEEGDGDFYKIYVSFYPEDVEKLFEIFELVKDQETTKVYLNNKLIPYIQDLWLFLMWFYRIK